MSQQNTFSYSTVTGYFLQDEEATIAEDFDYMSTNFGLIDREYESDLSSECGRETKTQWQRFEREVKRLNDTAGEGVVFKVLYLGRHGQGVHNVAEQRYGREAWDRHYASLPGDALSHWSDAHLTPLGTQQALAVHAFWAHQIAHAGTPAPEQFYTSPLHRCLETCTLTFSNLDNRPFKPFVKELLREVLGVHTCDRRSPLSSLRSAFPAFAFEASMSEEDELWSPSHRETNGELDVRMKRLVDDIFSNTEDGEGTFVSLTSHSGAIGSLLRVLGHREFRLRTGGVVPVLVRAERGKD